MGMLDRYKKKGGFTQLLLLLESSGKAKQDQLLGLIGQESKVWEKNLRAKILTFDRVFQWEDPYLVEVLTRVQPLTLAMSLHGNSAEKIDHDLRLLSQLQKRRMVDLIAEKNPTANERSSCMLKLVSEVRALISQGIIKLEKADPTLFYGDNFEEKIQEEEVNSFYTETMNRAEVESVQSVSSVDVTDENPTGLRFHLNTGNQASSPSGSGSAASGGAGRAAMDESAKEEIEMLRKKIMQLNADMAGLKQENSLMRQKLEQIKKIA